MMSWPRDKSRGFSRAQFFPSIAPAIKHPRESDGRKANGGDERRGERAQKVADQRARERAGSRQSTIDGRPIISPSVSAEERSLLLAPLQAALSLLPE